MFNARAFGTRWLARAPRRIIPELGNAWARINCIIANLNVFMKQRFLYIKKITYIIDKHIEEFRLRIALLIIYFNKIN